MRRFKIITKVIVTLLIISGAAFAGYRLWQEHDYAVKQSKLETEIEGIYRSRIKTYAYKDSFKDFADKDVGAVLAEREGRPKYYVDVVHIKKVGALLFDVQCVRCNEFGIDQRLDVSDAKLLTNSDSNPRTGGSFFFPKGFPDVGGNRLGYYSLGKFDSLYIHDFGRHTIVGYNNEPIFMGLIVSSDQCQKYDLSGALNQVVSDAIQEIQSYKVKAAEERKQRIKNAVDEMKGMDNYFEYNNKRGSFESQ